jgi:ABC-type multidrug transport system fused ATPase/permease subunit
MSLFRVEALNVGSCASYGPIVLARPWPSLVLVLAAGLTALLICSYLTLGSYTKRATAAGLLVPTKGTIRLLAATPGIVTQKRVEEGQRVRQGELLFVLSDDRRAAGASEHARLSDAQAASLTQRRDSLLRAVGTLRLLREQTQRGLRNRLETLREQGRRVQQEIELHGRRIEAATRMLERHRTLARERFISEVALQDKEDQVETLRAQWVAAHRQKAELTSTTVSVQSELNQTAARAEAQIAELERDLAALGQEVAEARTRDQLAVTAPMDGVIEDQRAARWTNIVVQATNRRTSTQKMTLAFGAGYSLVFGIESIAVLGLGAAMAIGGTLTVGMLMAFISYKDEFSSRMQRFVDNLMAIRMLRLHVERLSDIVLAEPEQLQGGVPRLASAEGFHPTITLDNVSFRYGSGAPWVLRHVQLEIRAGEHVAVVGATGCGKTTLAKIILGLLTPTEGTVRIDGVPLDRFGIGHWRRQIAAVMQDDQLFSASLQDNIAAFDETIDLARVQVSATLAAIDAEVTAMPMGYHTLNGDMGSSLSGGQKQRILLARALYRQPRVLVLDEATSHLDVGKERQVNEAIRALLITRITIAHRPETIAMADRVIDLTALPALPQIA